MNDINLNCDGAYCMEPDAPVRLYPLGGQSNVHLCHFCWARENRFRRQRGWTVINWTEAKSPETTTKS